MDYETMNKILYSSHFDLFRKLTPEQVYQIINKIGDKTYTLIDPVCIGIWMSMERDFIIQEENYHKVVERNRVNGKRGGRPTKPNGTQENPNNPSGLLETQVNPENLKDRGKGKGRGIDRDIDIDKEEVIEKYIDELLSTKFK